MWFAQTFFVFSTVIPVMIIFPTSDGYGLSGIPQNGFGCCMTSCVPKGPLCQCPCGFPLAPQLPAQPLPLSQQPLPQLPTAPMFPQLPTYPNSAYATFDSSNKARQQQTVENSYLQQPNSFRAVQGTSNQQQPSYRNAGAFGYNVNQIEQPNGGFTGGYATGPYVVGNTNLGDYSSSYSLPQTGQNENRLGALPSQPQVSGAGQYVPGPSSRAHHADNPVAVTTGTIGTDYNPSPITGEYEKKTKAF